MFFCWDITITANTPEDDPLEEWLRLPKGVITRMDIKFPAGCHGMVKVRLFLESLQFVPLSEDEWVTGNNETIPTETGIELTDKPYKIKFHGCSPDTSYNHTITVRIEVKLEEAVGVSKLTRIAQSLVEELGIEVPE